MKRQLTMWSRSTWTLSLSLLLGGVMLAPIAALAQYVPPISGLPRRREGAGTRGPCMLKDSSDRQLMSIVPEDSFSLTLSQSPVFFWYVPPNQGQSAEFALLEPKDPNDPLSEDYTLFKIVLPLSQKGGLMSYRLPAAITNLVMQPEKTYRWQFSIICDRNDPSQNPLREGFIRQAQPPQSLQNTLRSTPAEQRSSVLAQNGIWQDALTTLAQQVCAANGPAAARQRWQALLASVNLEAYSTVPLDGVCAQVGLPLSQRSAVSTSP